MFLKFVYPLVKYFTPLNVFQYLTFRGAYGALTTLLLCYLLGPRIIEGFQKLRLGQSIRDDGPQSHFKKGGTPTMGGVMIVLSIFISVLLWQDLYNFKVLLCLGSLLAFSAIGYVDDFLKITRKNADGLPGWVKFGAQIAVALTVALILYFAGGEETSYLYLPFFKNPVLDMGPFWVPFAVLLLVGESNAVNLTDGLDGLATGLLIWVFITLGILSYLSGRADFSAYLGIPHVEGAGELTVFCLAAVGACVGFLWFNAHPAEVFMGDVGSLSLGGLIATISLIIKKEILILIIGGVFVVEAASVILQVLSFKLLKKRIFKMAPLHHHFELLGWEENKVVIRFWILGALFAIIALSTLKIQ
ncbi:MAG: phospho-N-acetylmuramoyl-pentapeptide-transferase [Spirochaetaceae bacterium]|jgi:phospho-N-acetylmuramoyl-pentapeptide-transferase|nr:phospho-N-acetylmuramoyl-pentapeptide-transferase [Spirochaetaceae bacterium]